MSLNRWPAKAPRFPLRVPAVTEPVETAGSPGLGEAQNLSRGGVLLRLKQAMVPGAPVRETLRLRCRQPLTLTRTIAWARPHPDFPGWALGIRFTEEPPGELIAEIADEEHPLWAVSPR